jgi:hypothetical protein
MSCCKPVSEYSNKVHEYRNHKSVKWRKYSNLFSQCSRFRLTVTKKRVNNVRNMQVII